MTQYQQLELYSEPTEQMLLREVAHLREQQDKVRKSQYARIGQLTKMYEELKQEHEYLKAAMCRANYASLRE